MSYPDYQPGGGYYPQQYAPERVGSPAAAVVAAIVGLGLAGVLAWQDFHLLELVGRAEGQMPDDWLVMIISTFAIAFVTLVGAVLVFARQVAGAFILLGSALLTIVAIGTAPFLAPGVGATMFDVDAPNPTGFTVLYYEELFNFHFGTTQATLRFVTLVLSLVLMIVAVLPPSLNWLRGGREDGYSAQRPGW